MNGKLPMKKSNLILLRDTFVLFLAIMSLSIFITVNFTGFYHFFVIHYQLGNRLGLSNSSLMNDYYSLIKYLQCWWIHYWNPKLSMSVKGLKHFSDVKNLIQLNNLILIVSMIISVYFVDQRRRRCQMWQLILPFKSIITLLYAAIFVLGVSFNSFFITFHKILFRNRDWIFNPQTDPIIKALPENFFEGCFFLVIMLCILFGWILIEYGKRELKRCK